MKPAIASHSMTDTERAARLDVTEAMKFDR